MDELSCADLSPFKVVAGLRYAFPRTVRRLEPECPRVIALHDAWRCGRASPRCLRSVRCLPFNQQGVFRHYRELDAELDAE